MELKGTKGHILKILKQKGETTIPELTDLLGVAKNAVRGHLINLEREGLINYRWEKQQRGRPLKLISLSERAEGVFPKHYDHLLEELMVELIAHDGPEKLQQLVDHMTKRWAQGLRDQLQDTTPDAAVLKIAQHLDLGGMIASIKPEDGYYNLSVFNCIYRNTAMRHQEICSIIPNLIRQLTGYDVYVERSIHSGDNHCIYCISKG